MYNWSEDGEDDMDSEVIIEKLLQLRKNIFCSVTHNIDDAQKSKKETYNRMSLPEELPIGAEVLVESTAEKRRETKSSMVWFLHN